MGFKCKFQVGDFVKLNQKGLEKYRYRWECPAGARVISVSPYTEGDRTRYEYAVTLRNAYTKILRTFFFRSWELDHASPPCIVNIEELI